MSVLPNVGAFAVCLLMTASLGVAVAQENGFATPSGATTRAAADNNLGAVDGALSLGLTGERRPLYKLQPSDILELAFTFTPDLNQAVTIQPDGYANLRDIGLVYASGRTVTEFTESIKKAYSRVLKDPEVTISLKDFQRPYFIAAGEVTHPGKYELRMNTTLAEAIAVSGGFSPRARDSRVLLYRRAEGHWLKPRITNVKHLLGKGQLEEDLLLQPGDLVFVPTSAFWKIRSSLPPLNLGMYANPSQF